jgi:proline iminopeptidase
LRAKLPADIIAKMEQYEKTGNYEAPEYQGIMIGTIYAQYLCRLNPWPDPVMRWFNHFNAQIYNTMQGPNEFVIIGNFKDWDV